MVGRATITPHHERMKFEETVRREPPRRGCSGQCQSHTEPPETLPSALLPGQAGGSAEWGRAWGRWLLCTMVWVALEVQAACEVWCLTMLGRERTSSAVKHALGRLPSSAWRLRTEELWEGIGNGEMEGEAGRVGARGQSVVYLVLILLLRRSNVERTA